MPVNPITTLVFDWGDTLMQTFPEYGGVMAEWPRVAAMPGISTALAALAGQYQMVVATNASDSNAAQVRAALQRVELSQYIDAIYTYAELGARKPAVEFFHQTARLSGAPHGGLVMVGDLYAVDVIGAAQAGWNAVWYNPAGQPCPGALPLHAVELTDMAQLPAALGRGFLPSVITCQAWLVQHGGSFALWQHVQGVASAAYLMAVWLRQAGESVDPVLAHRGGLLHDVAKLAAGREEKINHADLGGEILMKLNQPELAEIASRHLLSKVEHPQDGPRTWEEKLVHFADKLIEGPRLVPLETRLEALRQRYPRFADDITRHTPGLQRLQAKICAPLGFPPDELVPRLQNALRGNKGGESR